MGVTEIIVLCMNCMRTLTQAYPHIRVVSIWEKMCEWGVPRGFSENPARLQDPSASLPVFALHDPCASRDFPRVHDAVRRVLDRLHVKYEEFPRSRNMTVCCGSGAMLNLVHPPLAGQHKKKRTSQTKRTHILTYCQECVESLKQDGKHTLHMLDMLFSDEAPADWNQRTRTTGRKWWNRLWLRWIGSRVRYTDAPK